MWMISYSLLLSLCCLWLLRSISEYFHFITITKFSFVDFVEFVFEVRHNNLNNQLWMRYLKEMRLRGNGRKIKPKRRDSIFDDVIWEDQFFFLRGSQALFSIHKNSQKTSHLQYKINRLILLCNKIESVWLNLPKP